MKKKVGICGCFAYGKEAVGGQTIKTRIIANALADKYGQEDISCIDTDSWKVSKIKMLLSCIVLAIKCKNIILLPAHKGVRVMIPLFVGLAKVFRCKTHYIIVGAWICQLLNNHTWLAPFIRKLDHVYAQTNTLKEQLKIHHRLLNVQIMVNFKEMDIIKDYDQYFEYNKNHISVCILSRIQQQKGIEDAIDVINRINTQNHDITVYLDIYGPIEEGYECTINQLTKTSDTISYKGVVDYNKTTSVLKNYYLLLFPTKYYTEGIPGTILDAYASAVPVLASRWESCYDVLVEGKTGVTYTFDDVDDFYIQLLQLLSVRDTVYSMKSHCVSHSSKYTKKNAIIILINNLI